MRSQTLAIFLAVIVCCQATYMPSKLGFEFGYSVPGLGYNVPGLGYSVPTAAKVVGYPNSVPALGYNTVALVKNAYTAPVEAARYGIVYDGGAAYAVVDGGYGGYYVDNGLSSAPVKAGYGSTVSVVGKYGYPLKK